MRDGDNIRPPERTSSGPLDDHDLEALENAALEAWCSDPDMLTMIERIEDGLADRVLAAETSPDLRIAEAPDHRAHDRPSVGTGTLRRRVRTWGRVAAGLLVGGSLAAAGAYALQPGPTS